MTAATTNSTANAARTVHVDACRISGCANQFPAVEVESESVVAETGDVRIVRYASTTTRVKRAADGALRVTPTQQNYLLQVPVERPKAVGLMLVGWGGNNGSTLTAAITAHQQGATWKSRRGTETPNFYGSLVMASTIGLGFDETTGREVFAPIYQLAPFVDPKDLVIGGWDISALDLAASCERAKVLEPTLIERLTPTLAALRPLPSIYDPAFIASNQSDRADNVLSGTRRSMLEQVRNDIR